MPTFKQLKSDNNLKEIIKSAFDVDLDISGDWGYTEASATVLHSKNTPLSQTEHIFASIRAYTEMSMTLEKENRYGSINLNEKSREILTKKENTYHKVTYNLTAMKEDIYKAFIKEYKTQSENINFDMSGHFRRRKEATFNREVTHWFQVDQAK